MLKSKIVCDACGKEINEFPKFTLSVKYKKIFITKRFGNGDYDYSIESFDLCQSCSKYLYDWLDKH